MEFEEPERLGVWRVLERLGSGAMGHVYLVQRGSEIGAAKVIRSEAASFFAPARFEQELELARQVRSPHVARVLDADLDASPAWVVSEFVPGLDLREHVSRHGVVRGRGAFELALTLWAAVRDLHAANVAHRDLHPRNVMMSPRGAVVVDLGVARLTEFTSTTSGGARVRASWSPAKQSRHRAGEAQDVHACASTLRFAMTGESSQSSSGGDLDPGGIDVDRRLLDVLSLALLPVPARRPTAAEALRILQSTPSS